MYFKNLPQREQYLNMLQSAGWFEGRQEDVEDFKQIAYAMYAPFSENIRRFLAEYSNLEQTIYLGFESAGSKASYDYTFHITKEAAIQQSKTKEYREIASFANEATLCIGSMGYYYPAVCALGKSGTLYLKHDYANEVHAFDTMLESIEFELRKNQDLTCVSNVQIV